MTLSGHRKGRQQNIRIGEQFNQLHEATARSFSEGQRVSVREYSGKHPTCSTGLILCRRDKVLYEIQVGPTRWIRPINQLRPTGAQIPPTGPSELSPEMLLDTSDLGTIPENPEAASLEAQLERGLKPRRWTDRIRKPTRPLQLETRLQSYVNKLQG
ncbi:hypothetical protein CLF_101354 [Clonorchis sinensis]|uniref:Uncharacterized protein n=1 Tax=Clonorchis sinensis TaxID=79923 RepID=G7Y5K2_CLOSI|nr:hypothetical protein CLF_101354 [Clonorchis sinensis]